jgi:glycosyltransferase involved in cell wall biosynthesis
MSISRPATILFVTSGQLGRNPRVLKAATTLGAQGYDVTVLGIANVAQYERFDREIMRTAPFKRIMLDHLSADWRSRLESLSSRARTWIGRKALRLGWENESALGSVTALRRKAESIGADLTIVHTETGFMVGAALLRKGRRVAADFEDWHSRDLLPNVQHARPLRLLRRREGELLHQTAFSTTTSAALAAALAEAYHASPPHIVRNVFPLQPAPAERLGSADPSFFWFSQTVGPGRMLESFIAAWRETVLPSRLCLLGDVSPAYRAKLETRVPPAKRSALHFLPVVSPTALPGVIAQHDLGLALEAHRPESRDLTIPNKIFQYLNAGIGVLATPTQGQREVLEAAPRAGVLVDLTQTKALTRQLDALIADPARRAALGSAARRAAEERFSWEREAPILHELVAGALAAASS